MTFDARPDTSPRLLAVTDARKPLTWIALAGIALVGGFGIYRWQIARRAEAGLSAASLMLQQLDSETTRLETRVAAREADRVRARLAAGEAGAKSGTRRVFRAMRPAQAYLDNPALTKAAFLPVIRKNFSGFYRDAALSLAQIDQVESMLADAGLALDAGLLTEESADEIVAQMTELLGPAVGERFADAMRTRHLRNLATKLVAESFYTEAPFTAAQSGALVQLFRENAAGQPRDEQLAVETLGWTTVIERARSFLSPSQLRALEAIQAKAVFDREYRRLTGYASTPRLPLPEK